MFRTCEARKAAVRSMVYCY